MYSSNEHHQPTEIEAVDDCRFAAFGANSVVQHAGAGACGITDRLSDEKPCPGDEGGFPPVRRARMAADAAGLERYAALKAHMESAGYTLRHTSEGILIVASKNMSRTMTVADQVDGRLWRVAP